MEVTEKTPEGTLIRHPELPNPWVLRSHCEDGRSFMRENESFIRKTPYNVGWVVDER